MIKQIPLGLALNDDATFANFYGGDNLAAVATLESMATRASNEQFIYIYGTSGVGRSHLLQACCHATDTKKSRCFYLPLEEHKQLDTNILQGLESLGLVCIDNIDAVFGLPEWEEALLHFYNRARDNYTRLIVVGSDAPAACSDCRLQDLRSRLGWGPSFHIKPLHDSQKIMALQMRAGNRGLRLSPEVGKYLLSHYPRNMAELFAGLDRLDKASMIEKRKLTIPFVKKVLA